MRNRISAEPEKDIQIRPDALQRGKEREMSEKPVREKLIHLLETMCELDLMDVYAFAMAIYRKRQAAG